MASVEYLGFTSDVVEFPIKFIAPFMIKIEVSTHLKNQVNTH